MAHISINFPPTFLIFKTYPLFAPYQHQGWDEKCICLKKVRELRALLVSEQEARPRISPLCFLLRTDTVLLLSCPSFCRVCSPKCSLMSVMIREVLPQRRHLFAFGSIFISIVFCPASYRTLYPLHTKCRRILQMVFLWLHLLQGLFTLQLNVT